jgi:hypothetical protein
MTPQGDAMWLVARLTSLALCVLITQANAQYA